MNRKVVFITGASSGLGLSLSKKFVEEGWFVIGVSLTRKHWKNALSVVPGDRFQLFQLNTTREAQVSQLIASIHRKFKPIDLVINNAGYGGRLSYVDQVSREELQKHIESNFYSTFFVCKYVIPVFKEQGRGLIINISSMAGKRAVPRLAPYSISKFGVVALSQCIAKENVKHHVKCITICPGGMNTRMRASLFGEEDAKKQQSAHFVAHQIFDCATGKIQVESGRDVVIRHGQVQVNPAPPA